MGILFSGATLAHAQDSTAQNSVSLTTVVIALPTGTPYLKVTKAIWCIEPLFNNAAVGNRQSQELSPYTAAFRPELERAGYKVVASEDNLFGDPENRGVSDYQVAAVITDMRVEACVYVEGGLGFMAGDTRGTGSMTVEWQVYSPLKKQVVARVTTKGTAKIEKSVPGGAVRLITETFASNARLLAANNEFRAAIAAAAPKVNELLTPDKQGPIALSGSLNAPKRPIADAVGSVVTILTGDGSGSGVLVSDDGYLLTNAHVVGEKKEIKTRWPDGIETVGQVVRVAKDRDIALVKTNPRERSPLPIRRGAVTPGQRVFAIGSPSGQKFQSTVSSGVISATRTIEGLRYIQSDVSISEGSSGGALLDENGSLIGITVSYYKNQGERAGLNMFIPISDAMDFLALEQH